MLDASTRRNPLLLQPTIVDRNDRVSAGTNNQTTNSVKVHGVRAAHTRRSSRIHTQRGERIRVCSSGGSRGVVAAERIRLQIASTVGDDAGNVGRIRDGRRVSRVRVSQARGRVIIQRHSGCTGTRASDSDAADLHWKCEAQRSASRQTRAVSALSLRTKCTERDK